MVTSFSQFAIRTTITAGVGCCTLVPETFRGLGGKRVVLFTDKGIVNAGIAERIQKIFELLPGRVELAGTYSDIQQDAKGENINRAAKFFSDCNADSILALGGGSVLDTAKAVKWMRHKGLIDIRPSLLSGNILEIWPEVQHMGIPHVAIPTTAGTGSEISPAAILYNDLTGVKTNIASPFINADFAFLDPELTVGLPAQITAFTGFDALSHAVEAYFSSKSNPMSDALALQSIKLIAENLEIAVNDGNDLEARMKMLMASSLGISALAVTLGGAMPIHNFAHVFGAQYHIPHGLAIATIMPYFMESMPAVYLQKIHGFADAFGIKDLPKDNQECLIKTVEYLKTLRNDIGLPSDFSVYNISEESKKNIAKLIQTDPLSLFLIIPTEIIENVIKNI